MITDQPFRHAVVDDAVDRDRLRRAVAAIKEIPPSAWLQSDHAGQVRKRWVEDQRAMPEPLRALLLMFCTGDMLIRMEKLTGIGDLLPDLAFLGGGLHEVLPGGSLEVHADFNLHPSLQLHRRVNALLYLNEGWHEEWGGHLELWARDMSHCEKKIAPVFNRLVVFNITDDAYHGHPHPLACPPDRSRLALALYYYTARRPEHEQAPFHWAAWQRRP